MSCSDRGDHIAKIQVMLEVEYRAGMLRGAQEIASQALAHMTALPDTKRQRAQRAKVEAAFLRVLDKIEIEDWRRDPVVFGACGRTEDEIKAAPGALRKD